MPNHPHAHLHVPYEAQHYQHIKTIAKKTNREKLQKTNKMDDLKNLTAEKVIPVTPEKQEEMSWEPTTEPPVTPEKQEEEVLLWQPYQTPKYWAYHKNYTSDWFEELQDETMVEYMFRGHAMKRAPKREYYVPGQEPPVYKWGQQKIHYPRQLSCLLFLQ